MKYDTDCAGAGEDQCGGELGLVSGLSVAEPAAVGREVRADIVRMTAARAGAAGRSSRARARKTLARYLTVMASLSADGCPVGGLCL